MQHLPHGAGCACPLDVGPDDLALEVVDAHQLAEVRKAVVEWLPPDHDDSDRDAAALVVTELVGNGLRHGQPPVHLCVTREPAPTPVVRFVVSDHGDGRRLLEQPPVPPDAVPSTEQVGGRGLWLVSQLAESTAVVAAPHGVTVVAVLPLHPRG